MIKIRRILRVIIGVHFINHLEIIVLPIFTFTQITIFRTVTIIVIVRFRNIRRRRNLPLLHQLLRKRHPHRVSTPSHARVLQDTLQQHTITATINLPIILLLLTLIRRNVAIHVRHLLYVLHRLKRRTQPSRLHVIWIRRSFRRFRLHLHRARRLRNDHLLLLHHRLQHHHLLGRRVRHCLRAGCQNRLRTRHQHLLGSRRRNHNLHDMHRRRNRHRLRRRNHLQRRQR
uniref:(northern house mosquito) hypothetical protein n=1 Tax=Culex pipiens TaxID=7175 RepID=A0A8D7ZWB4_CULPI